jgi:hypothetical protein
VLFRRDRRFYSVWGEELLFCSLACFKSSIWEEVVKSRGKRQDGRIKKEALKLSATSIRP